MKNFRQLQGNISKNLNYNFYQFYLKFFLILKDGQQKMPGNYNGADRDDYLNYFRSHTLAPGSFVRMNLDVWVESGSPFELESGEGSIRKNALTENFS